MPSLLPTLVVCVVIRRIALNDDVRFIILKSSRGQIRCLKKLQMKRNTKGITQPQTPTPHPLPSHPFNKIYLTNTLGRRVRLKPVPLHTYASIRPLVVHEATVVLAARVRDRGVSAYVNDSFKREKNN